MAPAPARPTVASRAKSHLIGGRYNKHHSDILVAEEILSGKLRLPNHEVFPLPINPKWNEDPFNDRNWKFLYHSLRWLDPVRRAYVETRNRSYAFVYLHYMDSWLKANQERPGSSDFSWHDMAAAHRTGIISAAVATFGAQKWLIKSLKQHGEILSNPSFGARRGNHALHVKVGLLIAGDVVNRNDWVTMACARIEELMIDNVDEEGVDREGSMSYQWNNYAWFKEAVDHIKVTQMELPGTFDRLRLMPEFMGFGTPPTKYPVRFGDSDKGSTLRNLADPTVQYVRTDGAKGAMPTECYKKYNSGYIFGRSTWQLPTKMDSIFYSLRFGPSFDETPHGQQDGGSLTLTVGDKTVLDENGRFKYQKHENTDYLSSNKAHNSVAFSSDPYDNSSPTELIHSSSGPKMDASVTRRVESASSEWVRGLYHFREHGLLVVVDRLSPSSTDKMSIFWQVATDAEVSKIDNSFNIGFEGSEVSVQMKSFSVDSIKINEAYGQSDPMLGWRSFKYGTIEPSRCIEYSFEGDSLTVVTMFVTNDSSHRKDFDVTFTEGGCDISFSKNKITFFCNINFENWDDFKLTES